MNGLEHGERYIINANGVPVKQTSRSNKGYVIEGVALHYDQVIFHDEQFQSICASAFDVGMRFDRPVQAWLDHDESLHLKDCRLELHSTETELNFRLHLDDSELAGIARDLVASKAYTECSVSWHSGTSITREIDSKPIKFCLSAVLKEISLCPSGVVKRTHCQVALLTDCNSLREDVESKKFSSDGSFAELRRKISAWENHYE